MECDPCHLAISPHLHLASVFMLFFLCLQLLTTCVGEVDCHQIKATAIMKISSYELK